MVSSVVAMDTSEWHEITLDGNTFKVPPRFQYCKYYETKHEKVFGIDNWDNGKGKVGIKRVDNNLKREYGYDISMYSIYEDLNINNHPCRYFSTDRWYKTQSIVYVAVGNSIYKISWLSDSMSEDVEQMISDMPESKMSEENFYKFLDNAEDRYNLRHSYY